jgi:hypothetical protein
VTLQALDSRRADPRNPRESRDIAEGPVRIPLGHDPPGKHGSDAGEAG